MDYQILLNGEKIDSKVKFNRIDNSIYQLAFEFEASKNEKVESLSLNIASMQNLLESIYNFLDKSNNKNFIGNNFKIDTVLTNGFQSWSKAYEYNIKEKQTNIRLKPSLLRFIKSDYEDWFIKKNKFISNFYITFYEKIPSNKSLTLISKDTIFPTTFIFDKKNKSLKIDFGLKGEKLNGKIILDKIYIILTEDLNEQKACLEKLFKDEFEKSYQKLKKYQIFDEKTSHVYGWESWYNYYTSITENDTIKNLNLFGDFIKNFNINSKSIFQIDDGWEEKVGSWQQNQKFPTPLDKIAKMIEEKGFVSGIWMAPLALLKDSYVYNNHYDWVLKDNENKPIPCGNIPLWGGDFYAYDLSIDDARNYIVNEVKKLAQTYKFKFLKLDFLYAGIVNGNHKNKEHGSAYYYNLFQKQLIDALPDDVVMLGCGAPLQLSYPFYPIMRIGADTREEWELAIGKIAGYEGRPSSYMSLTDTINRSILDKTIYFSDPDVCFLRKSKIKLNYQEKLLISIVNFILASQYMISDDCDDIDESLLTEVLCWFSYFGKDKWFARRFINKDLYFGYNSDQSRFIFINISNNDINISKRYLEKIFGGNFANTLKNAKEIIFEQDKIIKKDLNISLKIKKHGFKIFEILK